MKKKFGLIMAVLATLAALVAACTPTGGEPESIAAEPTQPAAGNTTQTDADLEKTDEMEAGGLEGVRWVMVSFLNAAGETVNAMAGTEVTAEFDTEGRVGGNSGCNTYFASYTVDGNTLTIGQAGSTMMACEPAELMQQEAEYLAALTSAATFSIEGDQLLIANAAGATAATFRATMPVGLTGTNWTATAYNTGTQAVTSLMMGTTINAVFTEDGKMNGSAGCNNYMTTYTLDGQNITIQPPATTRKLCPEPAGIMEQEAAFVTMLPQAATYSISGNNLELRTADGALIASFTAAPASSAQP